MAIDRVALVTGANKGVGKQVAGELVASGLKVYVGSRDVVRGQTAAAEIGDGAVAVQLDVTDSASIAAAAERIGAEVGRLDVQQRRDLAHGRRRLHHGAVRSDVETELCSPQ